MPLRLYVDMDSMFDAVIGPLRAGGIDILTSLEAGNGELDDRKQLEFALGEGRVIYTANVVDFARIHSELMHSGRHHNGIIVRRHQRMPIGNQILGLRRICAAVDTTASEDLFEYLEMWL